MIFKHHGILGMNARSLHYIRPYNKKKAIKLADDKIKTKQFLAAREVPVPKLYGTIKDNDELEKFDFTALPTQFVLKPNHGFGGEGIIPVVGRQNKVYVTAGGKQLTQQDLMDQINDILDGRYSVSNIGDSAFFEQLIVSDERIGKYSYEGLPDVRVVVHNLIPVMAMLRLPTRESEGKANLHMGAVGVGIDIAKGECTHIAYKNSIIEELPNGLGKIRGVKIPYWDDILHIASRVQLITNLGYMAIDLCIDKNSGPVLLEINARAGLGVQIANLAPLRKRLERIEGVKVPTPTKGVRIAKDMFGHTVEKEIAHLSGKEVISTEEDIEIIQKHGTVHLTAKIDTGIERSILDYDTAKKAELLNNPENYDDDKGTLKLKFTLKNHRIQTIVDVQELPKHKVILGSRDLKEFLIDTSTPQTQKETTEPTTEVEVKKHEPIINYSKIDSELIKIDQQVKLLYHLKPTNLEEEKKKFYKAKDNNYNPQFEYPELKFNPIDLVDRLAKIKFDDSPLSKLFIAKRDEISSKIALIESIDQPNFTDHSVKLFEKPTKKDIEKAKQLLSNIKYTKKDETLHTSKFAANKFEKVFQKYGLKSWKVKTKKSMVADCVAGKNNRLFIREDAKFTKSRIESLIVHEIETHILTAENGKMQPYELFNRGLGNYLVTQEGMAMYNVEAQRGEAFEENYKAIAHVIAIHHALKHSFAETFHHLLKLGIPKRQAFKSCLKAKRGIADTKKSGAFTKDYVYFKGYYQVREFIKNGGEMKDLYLGKINVKDLNIALEINEIKKPKILPTWLET